MLLVCRHKHTARSGFSLLEMTIVTVILAIGSAVALPRWNKSVEQARVVSMRRSLEADINVLRRESVRRSQQINVTLGVYSGQLTIVPPMPDVLGDASGVVNYATRFPGVCFTAADLNGYATCDVNMYGELVSSDTGQPLSAGLVTIASNAAVQTADLLAFQGTVSTPTPSGGQVPTPTSPATSPQTNSSKTSTSTSTSSFTKSVNAFKRMHGL